MLALMHFTDSQPWGPKLHYTPHSLTSIHAVAFSFFFSDFLLHVILGIPTSILVSMFMLQLLFFPLFSPVEMPLLQFIQLLKRIIRLFLVEHRPLFCYHSKKGSAILLSGIAMTWISNWFSLPPESVTCLVWKTLSLMGSVHVWFTSLYVLAVMPVVCIFPHVLEST